MTGALLSVNTSRVVPCDWAPGQDGTAIDKRPVDGPVPLFADRVGDDEHGDTANHGGPHAAVYAYAVEDADWWAGELDRECPPGAFGENATTRGIAVSGAVSGELWRVGRALLQVTTPRIPCRTFQNFWDVPQLVKQFTLAGRPGAYLRVLEAAPIQAGDPIEVLDRPAHGVTVADLLAARAGDRELLPRLRTVDLLPPGWRDWVAAVSA